MTPKPTISQVTESQFAQMRHTAEVADDALAAATPLAWRPGQSLWVIAIGAASHAGQILVESLRPRGVAAINLEALAARDAALAGLTADHYVLISQSGNSTEPLAAAQALGPGQRIVITDGATSPLVEACPGAAIVPLGGVIDAGVYVSGYSCTLVAMAALAETCAMSLGHPVELMAAAERTYAQFGPAAPYLAETLDAMTALDIVGHGPDYGAAQAAALLLREACALPAAPHHLRQYLHGPMESLGSRPWNTSASDGHWGQATLPIVMPGDPVVPQPGVLLFGDARERTLAAQLRAAFVPTLRFAAGPTPAPPDGDPLTFCLDLPAPGLATAAAQAVFTQLIASHLSTHRHINPGAWRFPQPDTKTTP
ncbi:MAG: hypothetical protein FWD59_04195 [Micrococcales bacterium]|nr:hypothetical protein [Micrococcales bacterium]